MSGEPDEMASAVEQWLRDNPPLTNAALRSEIAALQAELAEAREVPGRIVEWLNSQPETLHHDDIATAIEARDWSK